MRQSAQIQRPAHPVGKLCAGDLARACLAACTVPLHAPRIVLRLFLALSGQEEPTDLHCASTYEGPQRGLGITLGHGLHVVCGAPKNCQRRRCPMFTRHSCPCCP